jgi:ATP-binding cassette subfamily C protein
MRSIWRTCRLALRLLDPSLRWRWASLGVLAVIAALVETMSAGAIFGLVAALGNPGVLHKVPVIGGALGGLADRAPTQAMVVLGLLVGLFFVVKNLFLAFQIHNQEKCGFDTSTVMSLALLSRYARASYEFHLGQNSAHLMQRVQMTVDDTYRTGLLSMVLAASEAMMALGLLCVLVVSEPVVSLFTAAFLGIMMAGALRVTQRKLAQVGKRVLKLNEHVNQALMQCFGPVKELRVLGREQFFIDVFGTLLMERSTMQREASVVQQAPRLVMETLMVAGMIILIMLVLMRGDSFEQILPTLGLFAYSGFRIQPSINRIILHLSNARRAGPGTEVLYADMTMPQMPAGGSAEPVPFRHELRLEQVVYAYPGAAEPVLKGVDLVLPRGSSIGIVGTTGAGKSTLVDVILGLLAPQQGHVRADGADIGANVAGWQRQIGYVPQFIYLSDDTLRRNVAFGIRDQDIDEDRLRQAIAIAHLDEVVARLPDGLETRVGERGVMLSGGQRQRVGIARSLYHGPEILIFDEATSALDNETEREVSRAIDELAGQKTIILIAHRLSTLRHCDRLFLLKDGRVAAQGTYQDLIETSDEFRKLAALDARTA